MTRSENGAGSLLSRLSARLFRPPADMYLRVNQVDTLREPLNAIRDTVAKCEQQLRVLTNSSGDLREFAEREIAALKPLLLRFAIESPEMIPRQLAESIAYRGEYANALYRAFAGTERPLCTSPQPIPLTSSICHQCHFLLDQYRFWAQAMKQRPRFARKDWEWFYIAQCLFERGFLNPGKRGIGFGVGREPLPSLFASFGVEVVATDQSIEAAEKAGWAKSGQHTHDLSPLNERGICTDDMFFKLVSFREVNMNKIPVDIDGEFDFCWSSCSLEHLGTLQYGFDFIENSLRTLRRGGIAVHTTEFNLSSNLDTIESDGLSIYRRNDIYEFLTKMTNQGFVVSPIDWKPGEGFAELVVDMPPFGRGEPHIRLKAANYDVTSVGIIIQKRP